jgi:hypothetical protein
MRYGVKPIVLHLMYAFSLALSIAYVGGLEDVSGGSMGGGVGYLERVSIKVYGKRGVEWELRGEKLYSIGAQVIMDKLTISSEEYVISALKGNIDRISGIGSLEGRVQIRGQALLIKTDRAMIDLRLKKVWGDGRIQVWRYKNYVSGEGYEIYLSPLKVIIKKVKSRHDT